MLNKEKNKFSYYFSAKLLLFTSQVKKNAVNLLFLQKRFKSKKYEKEI